MVHGNFYGVQYEIYLNKEFDLYDDILPICIDVRKMIKLEKITHNSNYYKLVIISYEELNKRLGKKVHIQKYIQSLNTLSYGGSFNYSRKTHPELFKYADVINYKTYIKHNECPEPYTQEELKICEKRFQELINIYNSEIIWDKSKEERKELDIEQHKLRDILNIQRIIINPNYFQEIKEIERDLTDIELTNEEIELINKIVTHPKLEGAVKWHGINLIEGFY